MFWKICQWWQNHGEKYITGCIHFHPIHLHQHIFWAKHFGQCLSGGGTGKEVGQKKKSTFLERLEWFRRLLLQTWRQSRPCECGKANKISKSITLTNMAADCEAELRTTAQFVLLAKSLVSMCPNVKQIPCGLCWQDFRQAGKAWKETPWWNRLTFLSVFSEPSVVECSLLSSCVSN